VTAPDISALEEVLRVALRAQATRLAIDPDSITCPNPGAPSPALPTDHWCASTIAPTSRQS
jgi:hypothetical protein